MGMHRHISGSLKQTNKKHKGERKRTDSLDPSRKLGVKTKSMSKKERKHLAKQQRLMKNKMISAAQKQTERPMMCLLLPLCSGIDLSLTQAILARGDSKSIKHVLPDISMSKNSHKANYLYVPSVKKSFCFVNAKYGDLFGCLDLARMADWIVFVLPGDLSKIDMDSYSELMTALYAQGIPPSVFVVMSNMSDRKELLSLIQTKFSVDDGKVRALNSTNDAQSLLRFLSQSQKKPALSSANSYLYTKKALKVGTAASRLRSGMLVESVSIEPHLENEGEVYLNVEGLLRGWDMPLFDLSTYFAEQKRGGCPYVHVTGWGDFPLRGATWSEYKPNQKPHQPPPQTFTWKCVAQPDEDLADALTAAWENLQLDDEEYEDDNEDEEESDSEEDTDDDEDEEEMSVDADEVGPAPVESDGEDESVILDVDDNASVKGGVTFRNAPEINEIPAAKPRTVEEKIKAAKMELLFPDEIETPHNVSARDRFAKYRGIPRFADCVWPTENDTSLPYEYSKIFRFSNYAHNRRTLFKYTLKVLRELAKEENNPAEPTHIPSGSIISLTLGPIPMSLGNYIKECHTDKAHPRPLTLWSLLPYERCMSVLHLTMQKRRSERQEYEAEMEEMAEEESKKKPSAPFDSDPIMSKEPMLFQVGIRRFTTNPIYSQVLKKAKSNAKMERFFTLLNSPIVATMYAPVIYAPQTALQFRVEPAENGNKVRVDNLIATGSVSSVDPTRAIVKRVLLSGHPYKINKRSAVIRYMFHTPEDVEYFKPIQLHTKSGAVGHIKQSVGTHGLMKCQFDRQLIASDVVLMPLYKRVFPKMNYHAQVTAELVDDDEPAFTKNPPPTSSRPLQGILKTTKRMEVDDTDVPMSSNMLTTEEEALFS